MGSVQLTVSVIIIPHAIQRTIFLDGRDFGQEIGSRDRRWDLINQFSLMMLRLIIKVIRGLASRYMIALLRLVRHGKEGRV